MPALPSGTMRMETSDKLNDNAPLGCLRHRHHRADKQLRKASFVPVRINDVKESAHPRVHLLADSTEILDPASPDNARLRHRLGKSRVPTSGAHIPHSRQIDEGSTRFQLLNAGARRHIPAQSEACVTAVEI